MEKPWKSLTKKTNKRTNMATTKEMLAFSERMLSERAAGKVPEIVTESAKRPDEGFMQPGEGLNNVEVSDDYVNQILGFSTRLEEANSDAKPAVAPKPQPQDLTEAQRLEEKITSLVERLTTLLKEARVVMQEITSSGSVGGGTQKPLMMKKGGEEYPPEPRRMKRRKT